MKKYSCFFTLLTLFSFSTVILAQNNVSKSYIADSLAKNYEFKLAIEQYREELKILKDSTQKTIIENKIIECENGLSMLQFAFGPKVIAKSDFDKDSFFLHYPGFKDEGWIFSPRELNLESKERSIMYFPKNTDQIFFSSKDNSGAWNIYTSKKGQNGEWQQPQMLNENVSSAGDELFPYLSADGKSLYFSSNGHYGMGGFDLYVSNWDEDLKDWGLAQNLGFPYSSPANDFLYYNTPDGLFTMFASDRNNKNNAISIYVTDFENIPLKKSINPSQAREISLLQISSPETKDEFVGKDSENNNQSPNNGEKAEEFSKYNSAVKKARSIQKEIKEILKNIETNRELYNKLSNTDDMLALQKRIEMQEARNLLLRDSLNLVSQNLQNIEMEFLSKGILINNIPDTETNSSSDLTDKEHVKHSFTFANNKLGQTPSLTLEAPEIDLSVAIKFTDETTVYEFSLIPNSLIYQIQLSSSYKKPTVKQLKGINPVFEATTSDDRFIYTAGVFKTYSDALKNINKVKKMGFPSAKIVAFDKGKSISVVAARNLEKKVPKQVSVYQVVILGYTDSLPDDLLSVIRNNTEKDIAKLIEGGVLKFIVGPFSSEDSASEFANKLKAVSNKSIDVEKINKN